MKQPFIQEFDEATGEYTHREMTDAEYAEYLEAEKNRQPLEPNNP